MLSVLHDPTDERIFQGAGALLITRRLLGVEKRTQEPFDVLGCRSSLSNREDKAQRVDGNCSLMDGEGKAPRTSSTSSRAKRVLILGRRMQGDSWHRSARPSPLLGHLLIALGPEG